MAYVTGNQQSVSLSVHHNTDQTATVFDKITWHSTRLYRSEAFAAYSPLTMLFAHEFLSPFAKTTLWKGKVLQNVSTILSEAVAICSKAKVADPLNADKIYFRY